jgi:hypothetical protein
MQDTRRAAPAMALAIIINFPPPPHAFAYEQQDHRLLTDCHDASASAEDVKKKKKQTADRNSH